MERMNIRNKNYYKYYWLKSIGFLLIDFIFGGEMNNITELEYKKIKNKLGNNDYRLGLDLGVGSIGYCAIALKNDDNGEKSITDNVVLLGSRIFKASNGSIDRRQKRGQRNNHRHNRERKRFYLYGW